MTFLMTLTSFSWNPASSSGLKVSSGGLAHIGESGPDPHGGGSAGPERLPGESSRSLSHQDQDETVTLAGEVCFGGQCRKIQT